MKIGIVGRSGLQTWFASLAIEDCKGSKTPLREAERVFK